MSEAIQFFMDQHIPLAVSQGLRRHGVDVLTSQDADRCGFTDSDQLAFANGEQRVLVTFDPDFLDLHCSGVRHFGLAWCQEQKYGIGPLIQALLLLHGVLDRSAMQDHVEYL